MVAIATAERIATVNQKEADPVSYWFPEKLVRGLSLKRRGIWKQVDVFAIDKWENIPVVTDLMNEQIPNLCWRHGAPLRYEQAPEGCLEPAQTS